MSMKREKKNHRKCINWIAYRPRIPVVEENGTSLLGTIRDVRTTDDEYEVSAFGMVLSKLVSSQPPGAEAHIVDLL